MLRFVFRTKRSNAMSHTPNDLTEFFPADRIQAASQANAHFAKLADTYHDVNRDIHRAETNVEPTDDVHLEDLRKKRLALLDEMKAFLATH